MAERQRPMARTGRSHIVAVRRFDPWALALLCIRWAVGQTASLPLSAHVSADAAGRSRRPATGVECHAASER